jgi:hypothetical protein
VLALHEEPLGFADIVALTRYEDRRVSDALADIREMFSLVNEIGEEAIYQLGWMTRSFVLEQSKSLDQSRIAAIISDKSSPQPCSVPLDTPGP